MCSHDDNGRISNLRHDAFLYGADRDFVSCVGPFLRAGLAVGEGTMALTTLGNWALLQKALGTAADQVSFIERDNWYLSPEIALSSFDTNLHDLVAQGAPAVRVFAEIQFGPERDGWPRWTAYEGIINDVLAEHRAWIVCGYDARALDRQLVESAWETHDHVLTDGWQANVRSAVPEATI
jgi:hypothetical protein